MANTRTSTSKGSNSARMKEMETVDLGLKGDASEVMSILTHTLSNVQVLYVKTLNVHWNIGTDQLLWDSHPVGRSTTRSRSQQPSGRADSQLR